MTNNNWLNLLIFKLNDLNLFLFSQRSRWPRGKVLGGSSVLNVMLYIRGNRHDYDRWAAEGAAGWSWEEVFPYFLKSEDNKDIRYLSNG